MPPSEGRACPDMLRDERLPGSLPITMQFAPVTAPCTAVTSAGTKLTPADRLGFAAESRWPLPYILLLMATPPTEMVLPAS